MKGRIGLEIKNIVAITLQASQALSAESPDGTYTENEHYAYAAVRHVTLELQPYIHKATEVCYRENSNAAVTRKLAELSAELERTFFRLRIERTLGNQKPLAVFQQLGLQRAMKEIDPRTHRPEHPQHYADATNIMIAAAGLVMMYEKVFVPYLIHWGAPTEYMSLPDQLYSFVEAADTAFGEIYVDQKIETFPHLKGLYHVMEIGYWIFHPEIDYPYVPGHIDA